MVGAGRQTRRVVKTHVNDLGFAGEKRTMLVGIAANGHHVIEGDVPKFSDVLGSLAGNIDARLGHDADGVGVQAVRFDAGGIRLRSNRP